MRIVVETVSTSYAVRELPKAGEVWLLVESGLLYEMREISSNGLHRSCHRVDAPESHYGCDPTVSSACWHTAVREGRWIRVMNCPTLAARDGAK